MFFKKKKPAEANQKQVYTFEGWKSTFKPINNQFQKSKTIEFDVRGKEREFVETHDSRFIWGTADTENGSFILPGLRNNSDNYFVTEVPHDGADIEIPYSVYKECECVDEDGEPDPDCELCEDGIIDLEVDTVEQVRTLYGSGVNVVA